jgi:Zn-dependent peptidase ImmA (M78 family)
MITTRKREVYKLTDPIRTKVLEVSRFGSEDGRMDLAKLAAFLKIEIISFDFTDNAISGAILKKEGDWKILVNNNDSPRRKRFTVAHEMGHFLSYENGSHSKAYIDNQPDGILKDRAIMLRSATMPLEALSENAKNAELEANEIAAELLMPQDGVSKMFDEEKNVEEMADFFVVSESAMTMRLLNLGYALLEERTETVSES